MPYASLEDLIERAGEVEIKQVADRDRDGAPDPDVIQAALVHADNIVNGYIGAKYALPLGETPDLVRTWSVAIARHFLHRNGPPSYVQDDRDAAIAQLKDVARGAIVLAVNTGEKPEAVSGSFIASSPGEVFNDRFLRGW
jgi:phage gp36-like protein